MKNKITNRITALLLTVLLAISMLPVTALAAVPTIDMTQKGSVKIIKALNDTEKTKLNDVTFSYLKIADIAQVEDSANSVGIMYTLNSALAENVKTALGLPAADYTDSTATEYYYSKTIQDKLKLVSGDLIQFMKDNSATAMDPTGKSPALDGVTSATGLDLGLYLFVETEYPAEVTAPCKPFLISLPSNVTIDESTYTEVKKTDEWLYDVTAVPKNKKSDIEIDKTIIVDDNEKDTPKDDETTRGEDYQIGDTITYKIVADVPGSIARLEKYYIADALSAGLEYKSVAKVWGEKSDGNVVELTAGTEYTVSTTPTVDVALQTTPSSTEASDFIIDFTPSKMGDYVKVHVEYTAELTEEALIYSPNGNPNDVNLFYSKGTTIGSDLATVVPTDPRPIVYTYKVNVKKTGEGTDSMDGVKFELRDAYDNKINVKKNASGEYYPMSSGTDTLTVSGKAITIIGLEAGQYKLVETETLEGYTLMKKPIIINIKSKMAGEGYTPEGSNKTGEFFKVETSTTYFNKDGKEIILDGFSVGDFVKIDGEVYTDAGMTSRVDKYHRQTEENTVVSLESNYDVVNGIITFTVLNKKGFDMPTTGGMGIYVFTIGGLLLLAAAVALIISRKKKAN